VAPLRLGGLRGKQSTPSDWLGGTGEVSAVGERERHGAQVRDSVFELFVVGHRYASAFVCLRIKEKLFKVVYESL
jgi:hypothetical protein